MTRRGSTQSATATSKVPYRTPSKRASITNSRNSACRVEPFSTLPAIRASAVTTENSVPTGRQVLRTLRPSAARQAAKMAKLSMRGKTAAAAFRISFPCRNIKKTPSRSISIAEKRRLRTILIRPEEPIPTSAP